MSQQKCRTNFLPIFLLVAHVIASNGYIMLYPTDCFLHNVGFCETKFRKSWWLYPILSHSIPIKSTWTWSSLAALQWKGRLPWSQQQGRGLDATPVPWEAAWPTGTAVGRKPQFFERLQLGRPAERFANRRRLCTTGSSVRRTKECHGEDVSPQKKGDSWWNLMCFPYPAGGFKHLDYFFHFIYGIIILPIDELHHFSRWLLHQQPDNYGTSPFLKGKSTISMGHVQ